jgi:hypothetical protein
LKKMAMIDLSLIEMVSVLEQLLGLILESGCEHIGIETLLSLKLVSRSCLEQVRALPRELLVRRTCESVQVMCSRRKGGPGSRRKGGPGSAQVGYEQGSVQVDFERWAHVSYPVAVAHLLRPALASFKNCQLEIEGHMWLPDPAPLSIELKAHIVRQLPIRRDSIDITPELVAVDAVDPVIAATALTCELPSDGSPYTILMKLDSRYRRLTLRGRVDPMWTYLLASCPRYGGIGIDYLRSGIYYFRIIEAMLVIADELDVAKTCPDVMMPCFPKFHLISRLMWVSRSLRIHDRFGARYLVEARGLDHDGRSVRILRHLSPREVEALSRDFGRFEHNLSMSEVCELLDTATS